MGDKKNIKIIIEYDGTGYHGWQRQLNATSVQETIETALFTLTGETVVLNGAGRTDVGVHALGQVASFLTSSSIPDDRFADAINSILPTNISVVNSKGVDNDFHARYSAKGKHYQYKILNRRYRSPLYHNRAWHIRYDLNVDLMNEAAKYFIGEYNFSAFCASGSSVKTFERNIEMSQVDVIGDMIIFNTIGEGYLYNMVRIMVGTLVEVGMGKRRPDSIPNLLESRDRKKSGKTAPAHGLYLVEVIY